jgi:uncharacterized membrane protein
VPDDVEPPEAGATLSTSRMEALSDAVIAIAITLLVLDVAVRPPGSPLDQFLRGWPSYLAYLVSFVTIGGAWIGHNALTARLKRTDPVLLRLNLLFLLFVAFLPFPTRMVADALTQGTDAERVAAAVYGVTLLAIRLVFFAMDVYTRREHLVSRGAGDADLQEARRRLRASVVGYVLGIALAFLVPLVAMGLYFGIALYLVLPFHAIRHALRSAGPDQKAS